jgi:hypothetical protein
MKKSKALEKWCPMVRYMCEEEGGGSFNRCGDNPDDFGTYHYTCKCFADNCMMWRMIDKTGGYCGLAGKEG